MVEFIGMIKVNVVKGTNLAVRDMVTSDPYVMLTLGQQVCFIFFTNSMMLLNLELKQTNLVKQVVINDLNS